MHLSSSYTPDTTGVSPLEGLCVRLLYSRSSLWSRQWGAGLKQASRRHIPFRNVISRSSRRLTNPLWLLRSRVGSHRLSAASVVGRRGQPGSRRLSPPITYPRQDLLISGCRRPCSLHPGQPSNRPGLHRPPPTIGSFFPDKPSPWSPPAAVHLPMPRRPIEVPRPLAMYGRDRGEAGVVVVVGVRVSLLVPARISDNLEPPESRVGKPSERRAHRSAYSWGATIGP